MRISSRLRSRSGVVLTIVAAAAAMLGCRETPRVNDLDSPAAQEVSLSGAGLPSREATTRRGTFTRAPSHASCWTLIDAEEPDVLRTYATYALYAHAELGLSIFDVGVPADGTPLAKVMGSLGNEVAAGESNAPRLVARSEFVGTPLAVFVREEAEAAVVVFAPWDRPTETIVRVVDLERTRMGRTIDEIVLPLGLARDARRIGDAVVVTRELLPAEDHGPTAAAAAAPPLFAVTSFTLDDVINGASAGRKHLVKRDEVRLVGSGVVVGGSPFGIAVAREAEPQYGQNRTSVTWIGLSPDDAGVLHRQGTQVVNGVVSRWRGAADHVIDVSEDGRVRVLGCATAACPPGEAATYAAIDFAEPDAPRVVGSSTIARAGDGVYRFHGEDLIVARAPSATEANDVNGRNVSKTATDVAFFRASKDLVPIATVRAKGIVGSLAAHGNDVVAIGWTGSAASGKHAILHRIDAPPGGKPRVVGAATFGGDWTSSRAYEDDRVMSFDPTSTLAALPMATMRGDHGVTYAVQVFSFGPKGRAPQALFEHDSDKVDRILFVSGRLLAFSSDGASVISPEGARPFSSEAASELPSLNVR